MKKILLTVFLVIAGLSSAWSQCVNSNCSTYVVQPITFTTFPSAGTGLPLGDDQMSGPINIGFTFTFYCNAYTQLDVSSNGFVTFILNTGNSACCSGLNIPTAGSPDNFIALFWNDLYPPGGGAITYTTLGTSPNQTFVLTYTNIPHCCGSSPLNSGQIVLYEGTNVIDLYTSLVTNDGSTCTQGIENASGSAGVATPGRNSTLWTTTNTAYRFTNITATPPSTITGIGSACLNSSTSFTVSGDPSILSYVWTLPPGWTGTSTTSVMNASVGSTGAVSVSAVYTCGVSNPIALNFTTNPLPVVSIQSPTPSLICSNNTVALNASGALTYTLQPGNNTVGPPFIVMPAVSTVYTLSGTDANGCVSVNGPTAAVYVNMTPTLTVNNGATCLGTSYTIIPSGGTSYSISGGFFVVNPATSGVQNYTVIGTNSTGCISNPAICSVTVHALPNVLASATRTDICRNESTNLSASGASSYSWSTGVMGQTISVSPQVTTAYTVTGTDANNCTKQAVVNIHVSLCTGIGEVNGSEATFLSVYPNPSNGEFTIKSAGASDIKVYDIQGKLVLTAKAHEGDTKIDLSSYAAGEYLLKAVQNGQQQQIRLIKQ
ncbi:MAG TPA: T9SS type A sorting domain-containing protein [Bacteroidia bacterium]|nr:T9SS type A sorting domain-containing protein [Bacteroidia bacterium]